MQYSNEELAVKIQKGERDLLPLLWEQTQAFVRQQANRWARAWQQSRPDVTAEDLYQTGYIALCQAVETYKTEQEQSFIGWLAFYLKTEFAKEIGCRTKKQHLDPLHNALSLDAPVGGDTEDLTLGDTIADPADQQSASEDAIWCQQCQTVISEALEALTEKQRATLKARYWDELTLKEAGERLGSSGQNAQRWESQGLRALRRGKYAVELQELWYGERNLYRGTSATTWKQSGLSVQEREIILKDEWERHQRVREEAKANNRMYEYYVEELGVEPEIAAMLFLRDDKNETPPRHNGQRNASDYL